MAPKAPPPEEPAEEEEPAPPEEGSGAFVFSDGSKYGARHAFVSRVSDSSFSPAHAYWRSLFSAAQMELG